MGERDGNVWDNDGRLGKYGERNMGKYGNLTFLIVNRNSRSKFGGMGPDFCLKRGNHMGVSKSGVTIAEICHIKC